MNGEKKSIITDDELHAYADGALPASRTAEIAVYLDGHPAAAAQVRDYRKINEALGAVFDPVLEEPIPSAHVDAAMHRRPRLALPMAASIVALMIGLSAGWMSRDYMDGDQIVLAEIAQRSSAAYKVYGPDVRHPVEVSADQSDHLAAWLSNRMGMTFEIPKLSDLGFTLVGGRLMIGHAAPAALLMYQNAQGRRLVLYIRNDLPKAGDTEPRFARYNDASVVYWTKGATGYGLSGGFTEHELMPAAQSVRAQISS